ncbi:hypothetical protein BJ912DRAFT_1124648 [Pholiota molesta]|nr:hypothetical protein BJ912DRAFT_1124648 [Pholiota molesta]
MAAVTAELDGPAATEGSQPPPSCQMSEFNEDFDSFRNTTTPSELLGSFRRHYGVHTNKRTHLRVHPSCGTNGLLPLTTTHDDDLISHNLAPRADTAASHKPRPRRQFSTSIVRASNGARQPEVRRGLASASAPILVQVVLPGDLVSGAAARIHWDPRPLAHGSRTDRHGGWLGTTDVAVAAKDDGDWVWLAIKGRRRRAQTSKDAGERTATGTNSPLTTRGRLRPPIPALLNTCRLLSPSDAGASHTCQAAASKSRHLGPSSLVMATVSSNLMHPPPSRARSRPPSPSCQAAASKSHQ